MGDLMYYWKIKKTGGHSSYMEYYIYAKPLEKKPNPIATVMITSNEYVFFDNGKENVAVTDWDRFANTISFLICVTNKRLNKGEANNENRKS